MSSAPALVASIERSLVLPNGRVLTYVELGDPTGMPVVHCHGAPSSKAETLFFGMDAASRAAGVRLLAFDRPGIGASSPAPGRTLLSWADDLAAAADACGLERFGLLGYSVGAASALAVRERLGDRVSATAIVAGVGPADVPGMADGRSADVARFFRLAVAAPAVAAVGVRFMRWGTRDPKGMIAATARSMPERDQEVAGRPGAPELFAAFIADATRQGPSGVVADVRLAALPWGFVPRPGGALAVWHGDADRNVPVRAAHRLAQQVPDAELTLLPVDGHVSAFDRCRDDVLRWLAARP